MSNRIPMVLVVLPVFGIVPAGRTLGQTNPSPNTVVTINEGIYQFLQSNLRSYEQAIEHFTDALEAEPRNAAALLFRALSHGQLGLRERGAKLDAQNEAAAFEEVLTLRTHPENLQNINQEIAQLQRMMEADEARSSEWVLNRVELQRLENLLATYESVKDARVDRLESLRLQQTERMYEAAQRERGRYRQMVADLDRLMGTLDRPEVVVGLIRVIALAKIARIDEEEALGIKSGDIAPEQSSGPVGALRSAASDILTQTAAALEAMHPGLDGEDAVRTHFFLGVIRFRQAVPRRAPDEISDVDHKRLRQARSLMVQIADDHRIEAHWRSYAALYLGLIVPFEANLESDSERRTAILDEAMRRLDQALELDVRRADHQEDPVSISRDAIPMVVRRQREQIETLRTRAPGVPLRRNDLQISMTMGPHRDTNVVLLGERTDLPRDISRERDYGFTFGTAIDHTLSLSDRWTLGTQGRMSQLWHADVDEFDEQRYGGSVALQYELMRQEGRTGPVHLRLQYDYDYSLLGRSAFLESHTLTPNVRVYWMDRRAETDAYFTYEIRDYREPLFDQRFNRDGHYFAAGIVQSFKTIDMTAIYEKMGVDPWGAKGDAFLAQDDPDYPTRYLTPFFGLQYAWDATDGDEFDQKEYTLSGGVAVPLPWGLALDAAVEFQWQDYQHGSLIDFHRRGRRDFIQRYELGLSRTFVLQGGEEVHRYTPTIDRVVMTVRAHASYTNDDSNVVDRLGQAVFEYERAFYGITVGFSFN